MRISRLSIQLGAAATALLVSGACAQIPKPEPDDPRRRFGGSVMLAFKHLAFACLLAVGTLAPHAATAETPTTVPAPAFGAAAKREAIMAATKLLIDDYVFPELGAKTAEMLTRNLDAGKYDAAATPIAFAAQVTQDLRDLTHDKHLNMFADGGFPDETRAPLPPSLFGFARADRLKGNIGYIELNGFLPNALSRLGAVKAMAAVDSTSALIIDLRRNDGGDPHAVAYLISFFFDGKTPVQISDILWRKSGTANYERQLFKTDTTPTSYLNKPVYIIISPDSFSAAEHFAYDMQALKRATIVGQVSKGGANPGRWQPIGNGLTLTIPTGRSENPITRSNWEGTGVQPDIAVARDESFASAYALALENAGRRGLRAATPDAVTEARLLPPPRTTPAPDSEAALRRLIPAMADGQPPEDIMSGAMVWLAGRELGRYQADLKRLGALRDLTFIEVDPVGSDVFEATFDNGALVFTLAMQPDGKIAWCWYRPK